MSVNRAVYLSSLGFVVAAFLSLTPVLQAADTGYDSKEIAGIFAEARTNVLQLKLAAVQMEPVLHSPELNWSTHTAELTEIRELINNLAVTVRNLNEVRSKGSPRQQQAVDRFTVALQEMATNVNSTLEHLTMNRQQIESCVAFDPAYKKLLTTNSALATRVAALFGNFAEF